VCGLAAPKAAEAHVHRQILRCGECNAAVAYSAKHQNPVCGFCGAVMRVEEPVDPVEQPEAQVPMTVSRGLAKKALGAWLSTRGFFRPSDLRAASTVDTMHPLWWAAWVCDAEATVSWTADSNQGAGRSEWAPHSGQRRLTWTNLLVSASKGLSDGETRALTRHYDLSSLEVVPEGSAEVEQFDVQRSAARARVGEGIEQAAVKDVQANAVPGTRSRNVRAHPMLVGLTTRRLVLPAYVVAYRYGNRVYRAVVHGQNADVVIGTSPISWAKVAAVAAGVIAAIALIVAIVMALRG
jgi:hypothetical protein